MLKMLWNLNADKNPIMNTRSRIKILSVSNKSVIYFKIYQSIRSSFWRNVVCMYVANLTTQIS